MKKIHEKLLSFFESKVLLGILYGIGIIVVLALVFAAGVSAGFHKASFSRNWGENYERNFGMIEERGMMREFGFRDPGQGFPNAHGAVGKISQINLPNLIVTDRDNTEKVIVLGTDTKITEIRNVLSSSDLKVDDFIVVIGSPNSTGQIEAKFIRVMPAGLPVVPPVPPSKAQ